MLNASRFYAYYNNTIGNNYYTKNDYDQSLSYHTEANNKIQNQILYYNLAADYYKKGEFENAAQQLDHIGECDKSKLCFNSRHNKGNINYRLGEKEKDDEQIRSREQAISSYQNALSIKEDAETRANLEFVQEKLKEKQDQKNKQQQNSSNKNSQDSSQKQGDGKQGKDQQKQDSSGSQNGDSKEKSQQSGEKNQNTKDGDKQGQEKKGTQDKSGQQSNKNTSQKGESGNNDKQNESLSNYEKQVLDNYTKQLEQDQKQYQGYFNKKQQDDNYQDPFDAFFGDPFSNDPFFNKNMGSNGDQKDW